MRQTATIRTKVRDVGGFDFVAISAITVGEIGYGIGIMPDGRKKYRIAESFGRMLDTGLEVRPFTREAADDYGWMAAELRRAGIGYDFPDLAIAATALSENETVASNDGFFADAARVCGLKFERWEP